MCYVVTRSLEGSVIGVSDEKHSLQKKTTAASLAHSPPNLHFLRFSIFKPTKILERSVVKWVGLTNVGQMCLALALVIVRPENVPARLA